MTELSKLTEDSLLSLGFEKLPHFTVTNSIIKNVGRNRIVSVGCVGTANEMIWLCEINATDPTKIDDAICLWNFDYDGLATLEDVKRILSIFVKTNG